MGHFAKVIDGVVTQVIVAEQDVIDSGLFGDPKTWIQTSYNTIGNKHSQGKIPFRGNYAAIGYTYNEKNDVFIQQKPSKDAVLNTNTWLWELPNKEKL